MAYGQVAIVLVNIEADEDENSIAVAMFSSASQYSHPDRLQPWSVLANKHGYDSGRAGKQHGQWHGGEPMLRQSMLPWQARLLEPNFFRYPRLT